MQNTLKSFFVAVFVVMAMGLQSQAQKTVTYGKSSFTVYQPLPDLAPTPPCGFAPPVPGYTLKSKDYGPGTYYCYAPGNVPKTSYKCILTEIQDWVFYTPDQVKELAAKKGLVQVDPKTIKKMFKGTRLPNGGLMYKLSDASWIFFGIRTLENSGPVPWGGAAQIVSGAYYIERVARKTDIVLDKLYRFWNDGVRFADYAAVTQSNFETPPTAPTDQNPNNFAIGDVLNRAKGFYRLSFAGGGAPTYVWHKYETVVEANLKKSNFDAEGDIGYSDLFASITYDLNVVQVGKDLYFQYGAYECLCHDLKPGDTWQGEMAMRKEMEAQRKVAMKQTEKANEAAFEMLYKEIFK